MRIYFAQRLPCAAFIIGLLLWFAAISAAAQAIAPPRKAGSRLPPVAVAEQRSEPLVERLIVTPTPHAAAKSMRN